MKEIYDKLIKQLQTDGIVFQEIIIILKCSENENRRRTLAHKRSKDRVERGMKNTFSFYDEYEYPCIDTTNMTVLEVVEKVWELAHYSLSMG